MEFLQTIKGQIPDYTKDIRLNLDGTTSRSLLEGNDVVGVALAAALAMKSRVLTGAIRSARVLSSEEVSGALAIVALMDMNSAWYPCVETVDDFDLAQQGAELRMNVYASSGSVDKYRFEIYVLVASITGRCHFCIKSYYDLLKSHQDMSAQQLHDIGRIAAVINVATQVITAE